MRQVLCVALSSLFVQAMVGQQAADDVQESLADVQHVLARALKRGSSRAIRVLWEQYVIDRQFLSLCFEAADHMAQENMLDTVAAGGNTALHIAGMLGDACAGACLLRCGASTQICNEAGYTPLALAARASHNHGITMMHILLEHGADPYFCSPKICRTVLMEAAAWGSSDAVALLLETDARQTIDQTDRAGVTALMQAICGERESEDKVHMLLDAGADAIIQADHGHNALMCAASRGCTRIVTWLTNYSDLGAKCKTGRTVLWYTLAYPELIALLLKAGAGVDHLCDSGLTVRRHTKRLLRQLRADARHAKQCGDCFERQRLKQLMVAYKESARLFKQYERDS